MTSKVGIVGAGTMGQGIAQVCAQAGLETVLCDVSEEALERARKAIVDLLGRLEHKARLAEGADAVLRRLSFTSDNKGLEGANLVIEAAPESLELKRQLFAELSRRLPSALLCSNTSTLSITAIAAAAEDRGRVLGLHFFNPPPLMRLVEVIVGADTDEKAVEAARDFVRRLGKTPVIAKDSPGFIVNRLARPFYGEALRLHGEGVDLEVIDRVLRGSGFPMGPFELMDLIGIDVNFAASQSVFEGFFQEPRFRPHPLQRTMVESGRLGRKTGRGFYTYPREPKRRANRDRRGGEPQALILGEGQLARLLRQRTESAQLAKSPADAELIVDARIGLAAKTDLDRARTPVATLCWGHSTSATVGAYGADQVTGFSVSLPVEDGALVELLVPVGGANRATSLTEAFFASLGLPTLPLPDQPAGVAARIVAMLVNEAVAALAEGLATRDALDEAMMLGTNYPRGPLAWSEEIGLCNVLTVLRDLFDELGEDRYRPHPLLKRACAAGKSSWNEVMR